MFTASPFLNNMFSSIALFKQVQCPEQPHCSLSNCIFSHSLSPNSKSADSSMSAQTGQLRSLGTTSEIQISDDRDECSHEQDQPRKRRRLSEDDDNSIVTHTNILDRPRRQPLAGQKTSKIETRKLPITATTEVTPPPLGKSKIKTTQHVLTSKAAQDLVAKAEAAVEARAVKDTILQDSCAPIKKSAEVSLNPRMLRNPPASHAIRMQLITLLHEQLVRLNEEICHNQDASNQLLRLSPQDLILKALEEEENVAKQNPAVYLNIIKLRITKLKKMKLQGWKDERLKQVSKQDPLHPTTTSEADPKPIETGLTVPQEIAFLSRLLANQQPLARFGYVPQAPNEMEIAAARQGVEAAQGWEQCDRCKTRFQVFPGRREEDGALTSGGTCSYHPAKARKPFMKDKADKVVRDSLYSCCNESVGTSVGCAKAATHVFKISDPKRLSLTMPFKETPTKLLPQGPSNAVCFDCEMGYTTMGLELIRLTATSWPIGEELLDVLVRPLGEILDLNSQFSGVWPTDYSNAKPYNPNTKEKKQKPEEHGMSQLRLVESPLVARELLFDLLTPETPLIGHALDNDLNTTRIIHPSIVDSVLLYPHPRGLPIRFGLKMLMKKHLNRDIQMGGINGHDSKEDARAAGDLVRLKVADSWKVMQRNGWTVTETGFSPPLPSAGTAAKSMGSHGTQIKV